MALVSRQRSDCALCVTPGHNWNTGTSLAPFLPLWPPPHTHFCFHWQSPYRHRLDKSAFTSICSSPLSVLAPSETTHLKRGIWRRPARPRLSPGLLRSMEETCIGGILERYHPGSGEYWEKILFSLNRSPVCMHVFTILYKKVWLAFLF